TFDELRTSLSSDDTRWSFLDGMILNLTDGSKSRVRVFPSKWSITFEIDSSRKLNLAETSNRLKGVRIPVDPIRIEKSGRVDWLTLKDLSKDEGERACEARISRRER